MGPGDTDLQNAGAKVLRMIHAIESYSSGERYIHINKAERIPNIFLTQWEMIYIIEKRIEAELVIDREAKENKKITQI